MSTIKRYLWRKKDVLFEKQFPVPEAPTPKNVGGPISTGGRQCYSSSQFSSSRLNTQVLVKRIREISDSPTYLDGEEVEVINTLVGHSSGSSPTKPPVKKFHSHIIPSNTKNFPPVVSSLPSSIPPPSPKPSTSRPFLDSQTKPSPMTQPKPSPITTCGQKQLKNRSLVYFSIPRCSSVSKSGVLANQGYQRGSNCGGLRSAYCSQIIQEG
ncbi:hypothetical protein O181_127795 [Austropuccinia psidii MF-1]|uniref:Uncharacterized protein n=1 Tax=Austropuccinia psidii MF-1 TaxID=1389203 RepID=A0A9Q3Q8D6_9BASI|nr:hypothetical protein [Austropuccinia psidii MF-1]